MELLIEWADCSEQWRKMIGRMYGWIIVKRFWGARSWEGVVGSERRRVESKKSMSPWMRWSYSILTSDARKIPLHIH